MVMSKQNGKNMTFTCKFYYLLLVRTLWVIDEFGRYGIELNLGKSFKINKFY